jgi:hypothetical protein
MFIAKAEISAIGMGPNLGATQQVLPNEPSHSSVNRTLQVLVDDCQGRHWCMGKPHKTVNCVNDAGRAVELFEKKKKKFVRRLKTIGINYPNSGRST